VSCLPTNVVGKLEPPQAPEQRNICLGTLLQTTCLGSPYFPTILAANNSSIQLILSSQSISTLPVSSSSFITALYLFLAAYNSSIQLSLSFKLISTLPVLSNSLTIALYLYLAANNSSIQLYLFFQSVLALLCSNF
jgi:hypothetical protein